MQNALDVLRQQWGYDTFRPLQAEAIEAVLGDRDSLVVLPTGGGKSLCFQVPALCRAGMAVVVSPLISLMKDQVDALRANGVSAAFVNSTQSASEQQQIAQRVRANEIKLFYVAPERLLTPRMIGFLKTVQVSFFAIDEAHCISDWGHDFRPEYRGLGELRRHFPGICIHAYTATATERVRGDIVAQMHLSEPRVLVGSFDRPNLTYRAERANQRIEQIVEVVERHRNESGIVYCVSRKEVERVSYLLKVRGYRAGHYHAGMMDGERRDCQERFQRGEIDIIVATVAFGMGIDKPDVRYVVHAAMPKSIEHYQQESGRAGRDGLPSECVLIYSPGDMFVWKRMMEGEPHANTAEAFEALDKMLKYCSTRLCRHQALSRHFGQPLDQPRCEACDNCSAERAWHPDSLTIAQKILSGVMRLDQRFGADYTSRVLQGLEEERILQRNHHQLSTFGILKEESLRAIRGWIDELVEQEHLIREVEFQRLQVTETGKRVLRGQVAPRLSLGEPTSRTSGLRSDGAGEGVRSGWEGVDKDLFERLKAWRAQQASAQGVATYIVMGDAALRELAAVRPSSTETLSRIRGLGEQKRLEHGEKLLEVIGQYCEQAGKSRDVNWIAPQKVASNPSNNPMQYEANKLFAEGKSCEQVSAQLSRAMSTTYGYLREYLKMHHVIDASPWVPPEIIEKVESVKSKVDLSGPLKPIFEHFGGTIPYHWLATIATCFNNRENSHHAVS